MYQPRIRASNCSSDRTYLQHPTLPLIFHPTAPDGVVVSDTIYSINASLLSLLSLLLLPSLFLPFNPKTQNQTPHLPIPLPLFFCKTSHLPTLRHHDIERGTLAADARALDFPHDVHAVGDAAEDNVFVVQERGGDGADEELGAVGVGAGVLLFWRIGAF